MPAAWSRARERRSAWRTAGRGGRSVRARLDEDLVEAARIARPDSAWLTRGFGSRRRGVERRRRDVEARLGQRVADVVGASDEADDPLRAETVDDERGPGGEAPRRAPGLLDEHLGARRRQVAAGDDREPAGRGRPPRRVAGEGRSWPIDVGHLEAERDGATSGSASIRGAIRRRLLSKRTITSGSGRPARRGQTEPEPVGDDERRRQHRRGERIPSAVSSAAGADPHAVPRLRQRSRRPDRSHRAPTRLPSRRRQVEHAVAIAAASGSWVTTTTARPRSPRSSSRTRRR